ncbi:MAG: FtsQ-type POTRA domain-containing protein [Dermatophilaceae bacterium]
MTTTRIPSQERFAQRTAAARRTTRRRVLAGVAALALLAGLGWLVFASSALSVQQVAVTGAPADQVEVITSAAAVQLGQPLARVDTAAIAKAVVAKVPAVQAVEVGRSWPSTVTLAVTMRRPTVVVKDAAGQLHLTSADAVQYAVVPAAPKGVPVVVAGTRAPTAAGLRAATGAVTALGSHKAPEVTSLTVDGGLVRLGLGSVTLVWGDGSAPDEKAAVAVVLLKTTPAPKLIDVTAPAAPITR